MHKNDQYIRVNSQHLKDIRLPDYSFLVDKICLIYLSDIVNRRTIDLTNSSKSIGSPLELLTSQTMSIVQHNADSNKFSPPQKNTLIAVFEVIRPSPWIKNH